MAKAPECIAPPTALETLFTIETLSERSCDRLSQKFIDLDRSLSHGFTKLLMARGLNLNN